MEDKKLKIIFMGTPEFAVPGLSALLAEPTFEVVGVFTQPDKPVGRKQILTPPPIKILAQKYNIPIFQPTKMKPETESIRKLAPDLIVVIAYGKIIPQEILDIPKFGCINVHASLLPKYRGAACLNAPIINGDKKTGITIMKMEAGLDTGPILRQAEINLNETVTLTEVHDELSNLGSRILAPTLKDWVNGKITPQIQAEDQASYIGLLKKEDGKIQWSGPAIKIERQIRGLNPWPGTFTTLKSNNHQNQKIVKVLAASLPTSAMNQRAPGEIFTENSQLLVGCGQNSLLILKLQIEGKKPLAVKDFLKGNSDIIGQKFE